VVYWIIGVGRRSVEVQFANVTKKPAICTQDVLKDGVVGGFEFAVGADVKLAMVDGERWLGEILR
jgi:hypothetical protein